MRTIELGVTITVAAVDEKQTTIFCSPVARDPRCPDCGQHGRYRNTVVRPLTDLPRIARMCANPGMRISVAIALVVLAASIASTTIAPAHADCGDPGQDPCTGPVPTVDQVVAIMAELTDPNKPAADKTDIVTPGFTPEEAGKIDDHLHRMDAAGLLPLPFIITNIQPAPSNFAGATMQTGGSFHQSSAPGPIVLVDQNGHWLMTHHSAISSMNAFWHNATISVPCCGMGGR